MKRKTLAGILIGLLAVIMLVNAFPLGMILSLAFWIYLGMLVWKKQGVFNDTVDRGLAAKLYSWLKALMIASGILFPVALLGIIMHNLAKTEESLFFFTGIIALILFILLSIAGFIIFLRARQKLT